RLRRSKIIAAVPIAIAPMSAPAPTISSVIGRERAGFGAAGTGDGADAKDRADASLCPTAAFWAGANELVVILAYARESRSINAPSAGATAGNVSELQSHPTQVPHVSRRRGCCPRALRAGRPLLLNLVKKSVAIVYVIAHSTFCIAAARGATSAQRTITRV